MTLVDDAGNAPLRRFDERRRRFDRHFFVDVAGRKRGVDRARLSDLYEDVFLDCRTKPGQRDANGKQPPRERRKPEIPGVGRLRGLRYARLLVRHRDRRAGYKTALRIDDSAFDAAGKLR